MSVKRFDTFTAICDWPDCGADVMDPTDYSGMDLAGVSMVLEDGDWWIGRDDDRHYCNNHPTVWASDHEDGEPFPAPPYLLIHDGDTDSSDDNGKVSLIGGAS